MRVILLLDTILLSPLLLDRRFALLETLDAPINPVDEKVFRDVAASILVTLQYPMLRAVYARLQGRTHVLDNLLQTCAILLQHLCLVLVFSPPHVGLRHLWYLMLLHWKTQRLSRFLVRSRPSRLRRHCI